MPPAHCCPLLLPAGGNAAVLLAQATRSGNVQGTANGEVLQASGSSDETECACWLAVARAIRRSLVAGAPGTGQALVRLPPGNTPLARYRRHPSATRGWPPQDPGAVPMAGRGQQCAAVVCFIHKAAAPLVSKVATCPNGVPETWLLCSVWTTHTCQADGPPHPTPHVPRSQCCPAVGSCPPLSWPAS